MNTRTKYTLIYAVKDLLIPGSENSAHKDKLPVEAYSWTEAIKKACNKLQSIESMFDDTKPSGLKKTVEVEGRQLEIPEEWPLEELERQKEVKVNVWYAQLRDTRGTRRCNLFYRGMPLVNPRSGEKIKSLSATEREELDRMLAHYSR